MNSKDAVGFARRGEVAGFTLIELMVAVAVAAIVLTLALPAFGETLMNSRRAAAINDLVTSLNFARTIAVTERQSVTVCRSLDAMTCAPDPGNWKSGWITFIDVDGGGARESGEKLLRQHEALGTGSSFSGNTKVGRKITFHGAGNTADNGRLVYCDDRGWSDAARIVVISTTGRVRTVTKSEDLNTPAPGCSF